ncbi:MAG: NAD-dependent epimerase/dehydratase family protein [Limisphaerales bacterium]
MTRFIALSAAVPSDRPTDLRETVPKLSFAELMTPTTNKLAADLDHVLAHTRELWDELRGQRIFVTGATGFFGCWLLETFAWANDQLALDARLVALTRNADAFRLKAPHLCSRSDVQLHVGDVRDFTFPAGQFSHVIHAATESATKLGAENPQVMFDTVVDGTRRALEFAKVCGARKFLLTSSGAVYGPQPANLMHVSEEFPGAPDTTNPASAYAEGKRAAELLCVLHSKANPGLEAKIARCFAFVGPYMALDVHFAIGNFIRDALRGGPIKIGGDGTPYRSYLYAADLAAWLWAILFKGANCRAYNVGSPRAVTIAETAEAVQRVFQGKPKIEIAQQPVPGKPISRYVPDVSRAEKELGLKDWIGLDEAIRRTAEWNKGEVEG